MTGDPRDPRDPRDPLGVVREALLADARAEAARLLAEADADAATTISRATGEADALREEARARGQADAEGVLVGERARARREARALMLGAQRESYEDLRRRTRAAVAALRDEPGYDALRDLLAERARAALGEHASIREDPSGGVVAEAGGRRASYSLEALADQALDALGPALQGMWQP